ncbi:DUF3613 domain-containing protein [uncultured Oxalicibacterium sp.]|uniref:DUF3613 domain-containing protein n=1 Tax=uncultured Oxalicibacterium sp. TaxID=1168540 RepID=UPI0025CBEAF7|nr:DUF3613 domain-containing protein [uncultured Oxalicibacterium sp.]
MPTLSIQRRHLMTSTCYVLLLFLVVFTALHATSYAQPLQNNLTQITEDDAPAKRRVGETTTSLLHTQVAGSMAGPALPMLGPTANLSWQRYLESYKHPIPENFTRRLEEVRNR